jgi:predicted O-linked N-acetylglucosamine transferase (SPINDLY family)
VALPPEDAPYYSERPVWLPNGYVCFQPPADAPKPGDLPAIITGLITFGSFNTVQKLNSSTLALWAAVLRALPDSRLFLKSKGFDDPVVCAAFLERLAGEGVSPDRVVMEGYSPRLELLSAYQHVDIALDPIPYQGGVTILEAIWMGVPTLVLRGSRPPFVRHAESHLVNVGLRDWIAATEDEYVAKAVDWCRNLPRLSALRCNLRKRMAASPICDTKGFTRDLEAAYLQAWSDQTDSRRPQTILPMS